MKFDNHDSRIRYYELLLERNNLDDIPEYRLPEGFKFVFYKSGDRDAWIDIEKSAKEFESVEQGLASWNRYYEGKDGELASRMVFVENEKGEKVATASAFYDVYGRDKSGAGWLHWVAVRREYQGRGLSKPLIAYVLNVMKSLGYTHAKIPTQTTTWLACKIYLDFGFVPVPENAVNSREGWRIIKTLTGHGALAEFDCVEVEDLLNENKLPSAKEISSVVQQIKSILATARSNVARQVNSELLGTYWNIGRIICEYEQSEPGRADYGKQTLKELARTLTAEFGKGFSRANLYNMRLFYLNYEKVQTVSGKLSWSHYCELLSISDADKRSFYEKEAVNSNWSVRELKRQIESSLFERLLLSRGNVNKEKVLSLALKGNEISTPADIIHDPYVFEFLGLQEDKPIMESDLEKALVQQIEKFLLELGRGFMFVGTQQRVTINNTHYYVDMVFYNKILRAYVLIELKTTKLTPEAAGQINMYLNYYAAEVNDHDDNPPIGIILCTDKDSVTAEYALGGLSNNVFASRYVLYMPNKEQLIRQVEAVLEKWRGESKSEGC